MPASLRPYAKAVYPFLLTVSAVLIQWAITGELNRPELVTAITGASSALISFVVRNEPPAP